MSDLTTATADDDGYVRYFTEKLWSWIPETYRTADMDPPASGTLRALIETLAFEAAHQRRSIDRLWEDTLIDYADDWAVPYIGALLGTRMLSPLNPRGRRVDVANTVAYRRRGGTPWVIEQLVHDITGRHGALVEGYRRMARALHGYDVVTDCPAPALTAQGDIFATKRAGTANLRSARAGERVDGAFDSYFHMADLRKNPPRAHGGSRGLYGLQKLNLHIYRLKPYRLLDTSLYRLNHNQYTLDPSGRDVALFAEGKRPFAETDIRDDGSVVGWTPPQEWQMPAPIACRLLNQAAFAPSVSDVGTQAAFFPMIGVHYANLGHFRADYERLRIAAGQPFDLLAFIHLIDDAMTDDSPRRNLFGETASLYLGVGASLATSGLTAAQIAGADLSQWSTAPFAPDAPGEARVMIDPARGRVMLPQAIAANMHVYGRRLHYGLFGDLGAGGYSRRSPLHDPRAAVAIQPLPQASVSAERVVMADAAAIANAFSAGAPLTWEPNGSLTTRWRVAANVMTIPDLTLVAKDECRPYVRIEPVSGHIITLKAAVPAAGAPLPNLTLDGVWLGLRPRVAAATVNMQGEAVPASPQTWTLRLRGDYGKVTLRNVTLDPGGALARIDATPRVCPGVRLVIEGYVSELTIERSITGPIVENVAAVVSPFDPSSVGTITITDSLVMGDGTDAAISAETGTVVLKRSTVFGDVRVSRLYASEALIDGQVVVSDTRDGCFRFSAAAASDLPPPPPPGPNVIPAAASRLPGQFRSHLFKDGLPADTFTSKRFGDPGLAQLGAGAPDSLRRGAENGSEIGVFSRVMAPILFDDLSAKLDEYKPIETIAQFIFET